MPAFTCPECFVQRPSRRSFRRHQHVEHNFGSLVVTVGGHGSRTVSRAEDILDVRVIVRKALVLSICGHGAIPHHTCLPHLSPNICTVSMHGWLPACLPAWLTLLIRSGLFAYRSATQHESYLKNSQHQNRSGMPTGHWRHNGSIH